MAKQKTGLLTTPVKNYLLQRIAKAGLEPERLPSEMALCSKFGVSRITVRRAIKLLEQSNCIIRIPGKQGAFSNPEQAMSIPHLIGIITGDGARNYINGIDAEILTGFMTVMKNADCDFEFMLLNTNGDEDFAQEIENMALDGLLWIEPPEAMVKQINILLKNEYPVLAMALFYNSNAILASKNTISRDFVHWGAVHANAILKHHHRKVVRIGCNNIVTRSFYDEMRKKGISSPKDYFIDAREDVKTRLTALLKAGKVDAIISDGGILYTKIIQVLQLRESWKKIPFYMVSCSLSRKLRKLHPDLNIRLFGEQDITVFGKIAGRYMKKILNKKIKSFESVKVRAKLKH
jgi:hypothetical protein